MAADIKGERVEWGTGGFGNQFSGICVSGTVDVQAQTDPVEDMDGAEVGLVIYDEQWTISAEVVCRDSTPAPSIGDRITAGGRSGYVTGCREQWQNKGKKQLSITAHGAKSLS